MPRFKIKFSPDKVDTMVVQAIALLDDLDKEINIYAMRVKVGHTFLTKWCMLAYDAFSQEWYGWHFPEMAKIIVDNIGYAKCIKTMGKLFLSYSSPSVYIFFQASEQMHPPPHSHRCSQKTWKPFSKQQRKSRWEQRSPTLTWHILPLCVTKSSPFLSTDNS